MPRRTGYTPKGSKPVSASQGFFAWLKRVPLTVRATVGVGAAVFTFYGKSVRDAYNDRRLRVAEVDSLFVSIKRDTTWAGRNVKFDLLEGRRLLDHLEPHAVRALVQLIRTEHPLRSTCTPPSVPPGSPVERGITRPLAAIRQLQVQARRHHTINDRARDALIDWFAPTLIEPFTRISLNNIDLRGADLRHLQLDSATFEKACLVGARLDSAQLNHASFAGAILDSASFVGAALDAASFAAAAGAGVSFDRAFLRQADFSEAVLPSANFLGARLECARFGNATLDSASFSDAVASWTYFGNTSLTGVQHWSEIRDITGSNFSSPRDANDPHVLDALRRGAAPIDVELSDWTQQKDGQKNPGGLCALTRAPSS